MRTPYYREQALEGIACEVITAYDPNLYYGVPRMIPIEDIIEAQGITLEYQCLRKTGCVLGETIFDDGGTIIYDYDIPGYTVIAVKGGTMLENARYTGKDGYPVMIAETDFQAVQDKISEKNDRRQVSEEVTVVDRLKPYFRCTCGGKMVRLGGRWQDRSKVYLKCEHCGISVSLDTDETFQEVAHQMQTHECQEADAYVPSAEVIRLNNAINRGLEQPDSPEAVMALILQGAAARYDCCPQPISECEPSDCPVEVDWLRFRRVVSYITVASDAMVSLTFTDDNFTGKDK